MRGNRRKGSERKREEEGGKRQVSCAATQALKISNS